MPAELSTYSVFRKMFLKNKDFHMLTQEEVGQVQRCLLLMMDDIHSFCVRNELPYVMSGGCALGAARHGGFIPWDDDIDICMPRVSYEYFSQHFAEEFGDRYFVQELRRDKAYDLNFMKVRMRSGTFYEPLDPEPEKAGIFIDIFPVESVREGAIARRFQRLYSDGLQFICSCRRIRRKRNRLLRYAGNDREAARVIRLKSILALPFCLISFRRLLLLTEWALGHYRNSRSRWVAIPTGGKHFKGETYPRDWLFPPRLLQFEDRQYYGMNSPDRYLTQMYGDYHRMPPENERERHVLLAFKLPGDEN